MDNWFRTNQFWGFVVSLDKWREVGVTVIEFREVVRKDLITLTKSVQDG